jgi:ABC-2 type transport system permease protein
VSVMLSGYLGLVLLGTSFVSIGLLCSSVTENQIVAAVSCLVALLLLYVIGWPAETSGPTLGAILRHLSIVEHYGELVKGVIDTKDLVYFLSVMIVALFLTHRSVESLRWR